jgi:PHD/YefM family antitoxin component YafN of YafNO toxin-antitoxin module
MTSIAKKYLVDEKGDRVGVLLDLEDYQKLLDELEELESLRAYDAAKASEEKAIPFEQAIAEIEKDRDDV